MMHCLIVCDMLGIFIPLSTVDFAEYLNVVTGWHYAGKDLIERARAIETLIRRINIRDGLGAKEDFLPRRILEESHLEGPTEGIKIGTENFLKMREEYYLLRGWDKDGIPTQETIAKFGLDEVARISL